MPLQVCPSADVPQPRRCALLQMCLSLPGVPFCRFARSLQMCLITLIPGASAVLRFPTRESMSPGEVQLAHSILPSQKVGQPLGPQGAFPRKYSRGEDPAKPGWDPGKQIHRLFFFLLKTNYQVLPSQTEFIIHVFFFQVSFSQSNPMRRAHPPITCKNTHVCTQHRCTHRAHLETFSMTLAVMWLSSGNTAQVVQILDFTLVVASAENLCVSACVLPLIKPLTFRVLKSS